MFVRIYVLNDINENLALSHTVKVRKYETLHTQTLETISYILANICSHVGSKKLKTFKKIFHKSLVYIRR